MDGKSRLSYGQHKFIPVFGSHSPSYTCSWILCYITNTFVRFRHVTNQPIFYIIHLHSFFLNFHSLFHGIFILFRWKNPSPYPKLHVYTPKRYVYVNRIFFPLKAHQRKRHTLYMCQLCVLCTDLIYETDGSIVHRR